MAKRKYEYTKTKHECEDCGKIFDNARALAGHMWFAHGRRFKDRTTLYDEVKTLDEEKSNVLERIDNINERLKNIEQLLTTEEEEEGNPDEEEETLTREDIQKMLEEEFDKRYHKFEEEVNRILLEVEKREEKKVVYKCPKCEQEFSSKDELDEHYHKQHGLGSWFF